MAVSTKSPWEVVVSGQTAMADLLSRGYTRPRSKLALLPYYARMEEFLDKWLEHLETGIVTAVLVQEQVPALRNYLVFLEGFIDRCGLRFTKERHCRLIRLAYLIMTKENQWREIVSPAAKLLVSLIDGSRLTYKDLILDWRPVLTLYYGSNYGKLTYLKGLDIGHCVYKLKRFYDPVQIAALWEQLQVYISPRYKMNVFCDLALRFLPVNLSGEEQKTHGAVHWWSTLWQLYILVEQNGYWGEQFPSIFASLTRQAPDFCDQSANYEDIFTRILRALGLSMRKGRVLVGDQTSSGNLSSMAHWCADLIGGPRSCQPQLTRLMKCIEVYLHPSNQGDHTLNILEYMKELTDRVRERLYQERIKKHKRQVPVDYYLKDEDLVQFVECLLPPTLVALFNEDLEESMMACGILRTLAGLEPGIVLPKYLEHTYAALHAVCEPHRLTHTLTCLVGVIYQLAADHNSHLRNDPVEDLSGQINQILEMTDHRQLTSKERQQLDHNQCLLSLRHHLIYLLEALVVAVDINDVVKTVLSLQNIMLIYYLIPNVDASRCVDLHKDLSEDEKQLCRLTRKLPDLADHLFDKLLNTIQSQAICAPRNSSFELLGSLNDGQTDTGEDEQQLTKMALKVVAVTLCNSSEPIANNLIDKIYNFVTRNEFESQVATGMAAGILQETVFSRPETLPRFTNYVLKNLRSILTAKVRQQKELNHTALWFVNLASSLFTTSSQAFIENKTVCFEIIDLLCDCHCKFAHETGTAALWSSLFMLTRTYTRNEERVKKQLRQPLSDWVPVREWARVYQEHELDISWHVPDDERRQVTEELVQKFVFPMLERISDEKMDQYSLRRHVNQLYYGYIGAYNLFPLPASALTEPINPLPSALPRVKLGPSGIPLDYGEIKLPSGENVRERIVQECEKVHERMIRDKKEDPQAMTTICTLLKMVVSDQFVDQMQYKHCNQQCNTTFALISNPMDYGKRIGADAMDTFVSALHYHNISAEQTVPYAAFQQRVFALLFKMAVNDYPEVRSQAQTEILALFADFLRARSEMVKWAVAILRNEKSSDEELKGVLSLIIAGNWATGCRDEDRNLLWKALVEMKMLEWPEMTESVEEIWRQIGNISTPKRLEQTDGKLEEFCNQIWGEKKKDGLWSQLATKEQLEAAKQKNVQLRKEKQVHSEDLVDWLLQQARNREMHHTRQKMARTMLWRCQREKANVGTIKVLLSKLIDEEEYLRDRSADELVYWLKENKPKTSRREWPCPKRPAGLHPLQCGIRPDNLQLCYDSKNLPTTEEQWNASVFVSKQVGCYKWPKSVAVPAAASKPQLERGPLSAAEKAIVVWFESPRNLDRCIDLWLIEKRDDTLVNETTAKVIKYVLRNFPDHPKILENVKGALAGLLKGTHNQRQYQRLAAELFIGIAKGTRHRPFKELDAMWKWLAPEVDKLFERLSSDAKKNWQLAVISVLSGEDLRRYHWLVEQLILGMQRPSSNFHQAIRAKLMPFVKWRDVECRNRINEITWKQLPRANTEQQRVAIASCLAHVSTCTDANLFNDFHGVPERFRLATPDQIILQFLDKLTTGTQSSPALSESDLRTPPSKSPLEPKRSCSSESRSVAEDQKRMIYLRTLLIFIQQYYEESIVCLTPALIKIFPMIVGFANEDDSQDCHLLLDFDIQATSTLIVHDLMGNVLLTEPYADQWLQTISDTYRMASTWKVRVTLLKVVQVVVFSNIYVCERKPSRVELMQELIFAGLVDAQVAVRLEAARCLQALTHFDFVKTDEALVARIQAFLKQKGRRFAHGAILGFGAVVMAHPYNCSPAIIPCLTNLAKVGSKHADLQMAATTALREFRKSHRDDWKKTSRTLGAKLVYHIENAIAPNYYA